MWWSLRLLWECRRCDQHRSRAQSIEQNKWELGYRKQARGVNYQCLPVDSRGAIRCEGYVYAPSAQPQTRENHGAKTEEIWIDLDVSEVDFVWIGERAPPPKNNSMNRACLFAFPMRNIGRRWSIRRVAQSDRFEIWDVGYRTTGVETVVCKRLVGRKQSVWQIGDRSQGERVKDDWLYMYSDDEYFLRHFFSWVFIDWFVRFASPQCQHAGSNQWQNQG